MELNSLKDLYVDQLKDLYSAETQILDALPKMADKAKHPELKNAFQEHRQMTQDQVQRLDQIFDQLGEKPTGHTCKAMQGIIKEGQELMNKGAADEVMDAGLIAAAQRVEHYEIAGYGTVRNFAERLGNKEQMNLLQKTLDEEGNTDKKLTKIAEKVVNQDAMR